MDRREFIKKAGLLGVSTVAASAVGVPAFGAPAKQRRQAVKSDWDVVVIGGGPSGIAAAISASREGSRVLVIERTGCLGGMSTSGMVPAWCPYTDKEKIIYKGIAERVFNISKKGVTLVESPNKRDWSAINAEYMKREFDKMLKEAGVDVLFFSFVAGVEKSSKNTVEAITVANKDGLTTYKAKVFIDCSGDGDVAAWAGAEVMKSTIDEVQSSTLCFLIANVDTEAYKKGPSLHSSNKRSPIYAAMASGKYPLLDENLNNTLVAPGVIQFNAGHVTHIDSTNPESLSGAMPIGRQIAEQYCEMLREYHPAAFGNASVVNTAQLLGVRESRRIVGDYIFTVEDWLARKSFEDEIGRNCYYIDRHNDGAKHYPRYGKGESHGIPYRLLTPKGLKNVLVAGRCISADSAAIGSLRVMPPCFVTGEAAGMAANHAIKSSNCDVHAIDVQYLRKRLKEEGQNII